MSNDFKSSYDFYRKYSINPLESIFNRYSPPNYLLKELDKPIYRIFKLEYLLNALKNNVNVLVRPKKWEDPFENFYLNLLQKYENIDKKTEAKKKEIEDFRKSVEDNVFCQCWTSAKNSDAMWRIYSPNKDGICVSSTPRKLIEAIEHKGRENHLSLAIGAVRYCSAKEIRLKKYESIENVGLQEWIKNIYFDSLLTKRIEFKHEEEIRIIFDYITRPDDCRIIEDSDLIELPCDWNSCLDEIILDPRIDSYSEKNLINIISIFSGKIKISKSDLYNPL